MTRAPYTARLADGEQWADMEALSAKCATVQLRQRYGEAQRQKAIEQKLEFAVRRATVRPGPC